MEGVREGTLSLSLTICSYCALSQNLSCRPILLHPMPPSLAIYESDWNMLEKENFPLEIMLRRNCFFSPLGWILGHLLFHLSPKQKGLWTVFFPGSSSSMFHGDCCFKLWPTKMERVDSRIISSNWNDHPCGQILDRKNPWSWHRLIFEKISWGVTSTY